LRGDELVRLVERRRPVLDAPVVPVGVDVPDGVPATGVTGVVVERDASASVLTFIPLTVQ
jgi:hypothetical protein